MPFNVWLECDLMLQTECIIVIQIWMQQTAISSKFSMKNL